MDNAELDRIAAEERRAYFKAWRAANKDKTAAARRRYWEKKALAKLTTGQEGQANDNTANAHNQ